MVGGFVDLCRRVGLKFNVDKSKVMSLNGEDGLECKVCVDRVRLEHLSELKYLSFALNDSSCKANPKYLRSDIF